MTKRLKTMAVSATALLLGASAAFAASAPAPAVPSIADGFVSIAAGGATLSLDFPGGTDSSNGVSLEGAASGEYNYSAALGFQGDIVLRSQAYSGDLFGGASANRRNVEAAIHAFYRNDQYLMGAFGQYGNDTDTLAFSGGPSFDFSADHFYGGVEGQAFFGNLTLYGQAGGQQFRSNADTATGLFGTLEARYFLDPDFRIDAHIGADTVGENDLILFEGEATTTLHAGVGAEYRLPNSPISIFGKYDHSRATFADIRELSLSDNRFLIGAKFNFDSTSLLDRDRSGASLRPVDNKLPGLAVH